MSANYVSRPLYHTLCFTYQDSISSSRASVSQSTTQNSPHSQNSSITLKSKLDSPTKADEEDRRPSWRLKLDNTDKNRVSLAQDGWPYLTLFQLVSSLFCFCNAFYVDKIFIIIIIKLWLNL